MALLFTLTLHLQLSRGWQEVSWLQTLEPPLLRSLWGELRSGLSGRDEAESDHRLSVGALMSGVIVSQVVRWIPSCRKDKPHIQSLIVHPGHPDC